MNGINKVILVGNLGRKPDLKNTTTGSTLANLALATSKTWTDKAGAKQERTEWHNITVFGKLAEIVGQYCDKGSKLYVEGELETNKWQDNQGNDRYTTKVIVNNFGGAIQMLDSKGTMPEKQQSNFVPVPQPARTPHVEAGSIPGDQGRDEPNDDIPF
jgi:single-strand DNA-binding protein